METTAWYFTRIRIGRLNDSKTRKPNKFIEAFCIVYQSNGWIWPILNIFQSRQNGDDISTTIAIGEKILFLMQQVGFNASVQWPGFFNCFELYLQAGDLERAKFYVDRAYQMVCLAKGSDSKDAKTMLKYKDCPHQYLQDFKTSEQHFITTLTNC